MYVAVGTTSEGFKIATGGDCTAGGWTSCRPVLEVTDEYVDIEDCARRCDEKLAGRGAAVTRADSFGGNSGAGIGCGCTCVATPLSESRLLLEGGGLAPLGRATRLLRRSAR
jgi:hypothetical protein